MFSNKNREVHYAWFIYQWNIRQPLKMMITKREQLERMFPIVSREKWVFLMNTHTMTLSTKISLHVDKDSKSKKEGKQLLCEQVLRHCRGHLFVCLASSHSPFFWNILRILLWGTTPPCGLAMWFRWVKVYSRLKARPDGSQYFVSQNLTDSETCTWSQSARTTRFSSRGLDSCYWLAVRLGLLSKEPRTWSGWRALSATARKSLKMSLIEKSGTKKLRGEEVTL